MVFCWLFNSSMSLMNWTIVNFLVHFNTMEKIFLRMDKKLAPSGCHYFLLNCFQLEWRRRIGGRNAGAFLHVGDSDVKCLLYGVGNVYKLCGFTKVLSMQRVILDLSELLNFLYFYIWYVRRYWVFSFFVHIGHKSVLILEEVSQEWGMFII